MKVNVEMYLFHFYDNYFAFFTVTGSNGNSRNRKSFCYSRFLAMAKLMHLRKQCIKKEEKEEIQFFHIDQVEFNDVPLNVICPACLSKVETKMTYTPGLFTYLVCFGCTSFG